ncbi:MAG TPA: Crp/Fnr family transcriptional regulator, partial [Burkholderiaceae bacterium]|nr:Crp/Fnr family transcriptional regulator [Burkholderiaceae bacterium]
MTEPQATWRDAHWARVLTDAQLERVAADLAIRDYAGASVVCRKGERVEAWIGVLDGLLKISSVSAQGKPVTFAGIPPGGWFGEGSLLKEEPRRYDAVALRDSTIALMPRTTFLWLLDTSIPFNRFLLTQLNERLGQFIATVEFDRLLDPEGRVARCLAGLFNPHLYPGAGPRLPISQEEIGYLSGVSRQRVNQALQVLERAGLLQVEYGALEHLQRLV